MEVRDRGTSDLVAAYRYNGLNFRIGWHSDVTANGGGDPDGVVDSHDPWFWFCYDDRWRVVAVFRADDAHPKEVFVHHNAGLAGYGGSSYIDSVILRDRDTSSAWHEEVLEISVRDERVYYAQNWRGDVSALLTDTGSMIEWVKYSAYGVPYALPAGDVDSNGTWDVSDEDLINERIAGGPYDARFDTNLDGVIDSDDITHANSIAGGYQTLGRGVMSSPAVANRVGYAGYQYDPTFKGASRTIYHVRHRVYDADVGRWTRRDPLGYVDGMSLYEYVRSRPVIGVDPDGLRYRVVFRGPFQVNRTHRTSRHQRDWHRPRVGFRYDAQFELFARPGPSSVVFGAITTSLESNFVSRLMGRDHVINGASAFVRVDFGCDSEGRIRWTMSPGNGQNDHVSSRLYDEARASIGVGVQSSRTCATARATADFSLRSLVNQGITAGWGTRSLHFNWCCVRDQAGSGNGGGSDPPSGGGGEDPDDPAGGGGPVIPPSIGFPGDLMDPPNFPGGGTGFIPGPTRPGFPGGPGSGGEIVVPRVPEPSDELQPGIPVFPGIPGIAEPGIPGIGIE